MHALVREMVHEVTYVLIEYTYVHTILIEHVEVPQHDHRLPRMHKQVLRDFVL